MGMSGGGGGQAMADINVTPLVDVMLVLLIIFMVTAPMMNTAGVEVDLPRSEAPPMDLNDLDQAIISIDDQLDFYLQIGGGERGPEPYDSEELRAKLKALAAANPELKVFVRADGEVPYKHVAGLLGAAKASGIVKVGLVFAPGTGVLDADGEE
jgi:biopolymer transport protein TolR